MKKNIMVYSSEQKNVFLLNFLLFFENVLTLSNGTSCGGLWISKKPVMAVTLKQQILPLFTGE
jgi:hypothetical protein